MILQSFTQVPVPYLTESVKSATRKAMQYGHHWEEEKIVSFDIKYRKSDVEK